MKKIIKKKKNVHYKRWMITGDGIKISLPKGIHFGPDAQIIISGLYKD